MKTEELYQVFKNSSGVCTDTRQIKEGVVFFALKGANFNGNEYAAEALRKGAKYAVIDEEQYSSDDRCILVQDALSALQALANFHRRQLNIPFLAITGSNGKTTSKELITFVLSKKYRTYATKGNLNNHIGIPLTILGIQEDAEMAVIEMGANHQKEIEGYCKIVEPDYGYITNIGKAHLEGFGGIEGVKKGKGELYDYLHANEKKAFINSANPVLMEMSKFPNPILFPGPDDFYHCTFISADPFIRLKAENGEIVETQLVGAYNFDNLAAALCIGKYFSVPDQDANAAVASYVPDNNRSQIIRKDHLTVVLDAYNANPSSMRAALENFSRIEGSLKAVILGDMFELGEESKQEHIMLGELIQALAFEKVLLCGKEMKSAAERVKDSLWFETRELLLDFLKNRGLECKTVLIKGSRGMGLERVLDVIS